MAIEGTISARTAYTVRKLRDLNFRVNTTATTCTKRVKKGSLQFCIQAFFGSLFLFSSLAVRPVADAQTLQRPHDEYALLNVSSSLDPGPSSPAPSSREINDQPVGGAAPSREIGPFSWWRVDLMMNTLGAGVDLSTPLLPRLDLRGGGNFLIFSHEFKVDGLHYDAQLQLGSGNLRLDWFPRRRNFHISPGILYFNNYVTAPSSVPPGEHFELGDESFTNSVNDPVHGSASLKYPRRVAPMLTVGFRNVLPGRHEHISVPIEFGVAYTGAPKMNVTLSGTACQTDGCFNFDDNAEAQQSLKDEIRDLNDTLSNIPVYPVLSIGFGYRF